MLYRRKRNLAFWKGAVIFVIGETEVLLGLRLFLRMAGANPANIVTNFIYRTTDPLVRPFIGIFTQEILLEVSEVEFFTIFAMVLYVLISFALFALIGLFESKSRF